MTSIHPLERRLRIKPKPRPVLRDWLARFARRVLRMFLDCFTGGKWFERHVAKSIDGHPAMCRCPGCTEEPFL